MTGRARRQQRRRAKTWSLTNRFSQYHWREDWYWVKFAKDRHGFVQPVYALSAHTLDHFQ